MEFDFQRYIEEHREPGEGRRARRNVSDYAYRGDIKQLHLLDSLTPVRLMLAASLRLWRGWGRGRLLKDATRVSDSDAPRLAELARRCVSALHIAPQALFLAPALQGAAARAVGDDTDCLVAIQPEAIKSMSDEALLFELGRELGHIHNGHVPYRTAAFYSDELANVVVKWALRPANTAIRSWQRRSQFTADRAGLLCCQDAGVARTRILEAALGDRRLEEDIDVDTYLERLEEEKPNLLERITASSPDLRVRLRALEAFSESRFYLDHVGDHNTTGRPLSQIDDEVDGML